MIKQLKTLDDVVKSNLCLGCGLCSVNISSEDKPVILTNSKSKGHIVPKINDPKSDNAKFGFEICPGKGYRINTLGSKYEFGPYFNKDLGYYDSLKVVNNLELKFLDKASSSGIMTTILNYLIIQKLVDKVIVTKFEYGVDGPIAKPIITNDYNDLIDSQGSKYCPVNLSEILQSLKEKNNLSYAFVGTPCQIAGLRYIQSNVKDLGIKFFIGNFCGGFKSYNNLKRIIKLSKIKPHEVNYFRFRGGGQPGSLIISSKERRFEVNYPEYVKMTGYTKLKRCHFCVDATAELADFSCGDAWLKEYLDSKVPSSIVITRTQEATHLLEKLRESGVINLYNIKEQDVIKSQEGNIRSKKHRQGNRMKLYKLFNITTSEIKEGYQKSNASLFTELNVFISHKVKFCFEKIGLFYFLYYKNRFFKRIFFRIFKDNFN